MVDKLYKIMKAVAMLYGVFVIVMYAIQIYEHRLNVADASMVAGFYILLFVIDTAVQKAELIK